MMPNLDEHMTPPCRTPIDQVLPRSQFSHTRYWLERLGLGGIIGLFLLVGGILLLPRLHLMLSTPDPAVSQEQAMQQSRDTLAANLVLGEAQADTKNTETGLRQTLLNTPCAQNRAPLVDRRGNLLAFSVDNKSEFAIDPRQYRLTSPQMVEELAQTLHQIIPSRPLAKIRQALTGDTRRVVSVGISPAQVKAIQALEGAFAPSFSITPVASRLYPEGEIFAHIVGYLNDDHCAASGLEKTLTPLTTAQDTPVVLSLDSDLQYMVAQVLKQAMQSTRSEQAYTLIMDMHTGEILSEVALPSFDPNQKNYIVNNQPERWKVVSQNAIDRKFELGSLLKVQNTALALENNVTLDQVFDTTEQLYTNGFPIAETSRPRFDYSVASILMKSSNWGSARMALSIGGDKQRDFLARFGLGDHHSLSADLSQSRTATLSFGYGVKISLRQYAAATAALLNGGYAVTPTYQRVDAGHRHARRVYDEVASHQLARLLLTNVVHKQGTGKGAYRQGVMLGGKTGTAKIPNPAGGYFEDTRASFMGFFPAHQPRYILLTSLVKPRDKDGEPANAGVVTAPVVGEIARRMAVQYAMLLSPEETEFLEQQYILRTQFDEIRLARN